MGGDEVGGAHAKAFRVQGARDACQSGIPMIRRAGDFASRTGGAG